MKMHPDDGPCPCPYCNPVEQICVECKRAPGEERGSGWVFCEECQAAYDAAVAADALENL